MRRNITFFTICISRPQNKRGSNNLNVFVMVKNSGNRRTYQSLLLYPFKKLLRQGCLHLLLFG